MHGGRRMQLSTRLSLPPQSGKVPGDHNIEVLLDINVGNAHVDPR
jgi:hypothetical protein